MFWIVFGPFLFWLAVIAVASFERRRIPTLAPGTPAPAAPPRVAVFVPVRNEEKKVERCLRSLLAQTGISPRLVAIDDGSTDRTREILAGIAASDPRLTVVEAPPLPEGWTGKCHALWTGVQGATEDWLLFTDADTIHHPETLSAAISLGESSRADAVTLLPWVPCEDFWTRAVNPVVAFLLAALLLPTSPRDPRRKRPLLNGQYLLIRRAAYERIGGHRRVRARVVEDLAIGEQLVLYKLRLVHAAAPEMLITDMYAGLPELWAGWGKGMVETLRGRPFRAAALFASMLWLFVFPFAYWAYEALHLPFAILGTAFWGEITPVEAFGFVLTGAACALSIPARSEIHRQLRIPAKFALALPLGGAVVAGLIAASYVRGLVGAGATWKGRTYK